MAKKSKKDAPLTIDELERLSKEAEAKGETIICGGVYMPLIDEEKFK